MNDPDADLGHLRRDAAANRRRIVAAAAELFAAKGIETGYEEIARHAGVGVGTVYRRFPRREQLVEALFRDRIGDVVAVAHSALMEPDPWLGLVSFLERTTQMQVADRGLKEVLATLEFVEGAAGAVAEAREQLTPIVGQLLARAKAAGVLREDFESEDIGIITSSLSSLTTEASPDLWRRYLVVVLDGLRPSRAEPSCLPVPAPEPEDLA